MISVRSSRICSSACAAFAGSVAPMTTGTSLKSFRVFCREGDLHLDGNAPTWSAVVDGRRRVGDDCCHQSGRCTGQRGSRANGLILASARLGGDWHVAERRAKGVASVTERGQTGVMAGSHDHDGFVFAPGRSL